MNINKPILALTTGAICISFSGVFVKTSEVPSTVSAFYRVLFGSLFIVIACFYHREFKLKSWRKNLQAVFCGLLFAGDLFAWHISIQSVGPGLATILGNFQVFILSFIGIIFFKEKVGLLYYLSVPLAVFGLFLIIGVDIAQLSKEYLKGIWFGLATACFYAAFLICLRNLQGKEKNAPVFYYQVILLLSCTIFLGGKVYVSGESFVIPSSTSLASLLGLGFLSQAVGWVIISFSLPKVQASLAGLILLLQPSLSFVWDVLFFDRPTGLIGWLGLSIVMVAIYLSAFRKTDQTATHQVSVPASNQ
ncbi:MAG: DMT family transporter [Proteobacteria bacterium]|nr:DMT family transporter [Pseudomonadota bacterium]